MELDRIKRIVENAAESVAKADFVEVKSIVYGRRKIDVTMTVNDKDMTARVTYESGESWFYSYLTIVSAVERELHKQALRSYVQGCDWMDALTREEIENAMHDAEIHNCALDIHRAFDCLQKAYEAGKVSDEEFVTERVSLSAIVESWFSR